MELPLTEISLEISTLAFKGRACNKARYLTNEVKVNRMRDFVQIFLLANLCGLNIHLTLVSRIGNALMLHAVWKIPSFRWCYLISLLMTVYNRNKSQILKGIETNTGPLYIVLDIKSKLQAEYIWCKKNSTN